jgi:hypothetical protein
LNGSDKAVTSGKVRELAGLMIATGLTRFIFRSRYLYDIDSVNFALAMRRFDPAVHQPHPPGYFLYILLGRLVDTALHDANTSLVAISIAFSCGAAAIIWVLTNCWFGRSAARWAGLIFLVSPLAWFHGIVALTYIVEAFFSALVGYLCWQLYSGSPRFALPAAVAAGVAAGFRPSSILVLGPLFLFSLSGVSRRRVAAGIGVFVLTLLAWSVPMLRISGASAYATSLVSLWLTVPATGSVFNSTVMNSVARLLVVASGYVLCFGCAAIFPFVSPQSEQAGQRKRILFTQVWVTPGLLFFALVFLRFVNSGYLLVLMPPVCAWMGLWAHKWYQDSAIPKPFRAWVVAAGAVLNTVAFIYTPVYCSYGDVRAFEKELGNIIAALPGVAAPAETMIVGMDSHFLGYRHAGYYLPGYLTVEFPEVHRTDGARVFSMRDRDTRVTSALATISPSSIQYFVIFPLPLGDSEYSDYMALVRKRFPPGDLHLINRSGHEFAVGPARDLGLLFPSLMAPALAAEDRR